MNIKAELHYVCVCMIHFCLQFICTSKVRSIRQLGLLVPFGEDAHDAMLDEVHLLPDGSFSYDVISRLEDLEAKFGEHRRHEIRISVGEQRHRRHQLSTVEVYDLLNTL